MAATSLRKALKDYYDSKELSKGQLNELVGLQESRRVFDRRALLIGLATVVACALILLVNMLQQSFDPLSTLIAQEVAYNHNKNMNMEIATDSIREIQSRLNRLDFTLVNSLKLSTGYAILGGRYCSIQGKIAAQIKIKKNSTGEVYTLYQVPIQTGWDKQDLLGKAQAIDGTLVSIWIEKGLLLALAGPE